MTSRPFIDLHRRLRALDSTRVRIESLADDGEVGEHDVRRMYEGLFLNAVASFEAFLEEVFVSILVRNKASTPLDGKINPKIVVLSHSVAREILIGPGRPYTEWLPYIRTLEKAEIFLTGGRPFSTLPDQLKGQLTRCQLIRNAIAHQSRAAKTRFETGVIAGLPLPPRERTPAGYLRSNHSLSPPLTRFEFLFTQMGLSAQMLT